MAHYLIEQGYIPWDKSWIIRMGVQDLLSGGVDHYEDSMNFLRRHEGGLNDDLTALSKALPAFRYDWLVGVGESATLYRFLKFASWKRGVKRAFLHRGTLSRRISNGMICNKPDIVDYPQAELLKLDNGTTQWASAAAICGDEERLENPRPKLALTYEAIGHWRQRRGTGMCWEPRRDSTILAQAAAFLELLNTGSTGFVSKEAEDYCFARAFDLGDWKGMEREWTSLLGHESVRTDEMGRALERAGRGESIGSRDHRVVQAVAMLKKYRGQELRMDYPEAVNKSWPEFFEFLKESPRLKGMQAGASGIMRPVL